MGQEYEIGPIEKEGFVFPVVAASSPESAEAVKDSAPTNPK